MLILSYTMELIDCKIGTLARIISALRTNTAKDHSVWDITKLSGISYSHTYNILKMLEKEKMVKILRSGRSNVVTIKNRLLKFKLCEVENA